MPLNVIRAFQREQRGTMDIKRVGPGGSPAQGPEGKRDGGKTFSAAAPNADNAPEPPALAGIPSGFTRADLSDEKKVDEAVRHCVDVAVQNASDKVNGGLGEHERAHLAEVLGNDPAFRAQVLRYLDQALK